MYLIDSLKYWLSVLTTLYLQHSLHRYLQWLSWWALFACMWTCIHNRRQCLRLQLKWRVSGFNRFVFVQEVVNATLLEKVQTSIERTKSLQMLYIHINHASVMDTILKGARENISLKRLIIWLSLPDQDVVCLKAAAGKLRQVRPRLELQFLWLTCMHSPLHESWPMMYIYMCAWTMFYCYSFTAYSEQYNQIFQAQLIQWNDLYTLWVMPSPCTIHIIVLVWHTCIGWSSCRPQDSACDLTATHALFITYCPHTSGT